MPCRDRTVRYCGQSPSHGNGARRRAAASLSIKVSLPLPQWTWHCDKFRRTPCDDSECSRLANLTT
eukprot:748682-Hanusia_phi.AAC.2